MSLLCQIEMTLPGGFAELAHEPSMLKRARSNNGSGFMDWCIGRNDDALRVVKTLKDGAGRYLWLASPAESEPDAILGHPYTINRDVPAIAPSAKSILFGDFSKYFIRRITGVRVLRLVERYADYNQTAFVAFQRWDGALVDAGTHPIKYLQMAA
jgi:HK97 family phage major capsid protein